MSLAEHLKNADDMAMVAYHANRVFFRCQKHFPKSSMLMKWLYRLVKGHAGSLLDNVLCDLDSDYHRVISDSEFREHGHIYYSLDARYERLMVEKEGHKPGSQGCGE